MFVVISGMSSVHERPLFLFQWLCYFVTLRNGTVYITAHFMTQIIQS